MNLLLSKTYINFASLHFSSNTVVLGAAVATILTFAAAVFVTFQTIRGSDAIVEWVLHRSRYRTVHKTLRGFQILGIYLRMAEQVRRMKLREGVPSTVEFEVKWLLLVLRLMQKRNSRTLEIDGLASDPDPSTQLYLLSKAYEQLSQRLNARVLLTSSRLLAKQQKQAAKVAEYLKMNADFSSGPPKPIQILVIRIPRLKTVLEFVNPRMNFSPASHIDHIAVVHSHSRRVVKGFPTRNEIDTDLTLVEEELDESRGELSRLLSHFEGRDFDGVLPALHKIAVQQDPFSGHLRMLLELSEITYSAVRAFNYVGTAGVGRSYEELASASVGKDRLLSLSMLPVTSDGFMMLARRSPFVTIGANRFSPAVNGNLELRDRLGLSVDRDTFGMPDPLAALAREAKEEMGLDVKGIDIQVMGLSQFANQEEVNTWILLTSVLVDVSAKQFVENSRYADQIEGAWETTGEFLALLNPRDRLSAIETIRWAVNSPDLMPAGILVVLSLSMPFLWVKDKTTISSLEVDISRLLTDEPVPFPIGSILYFKEN